MKKVKDAHFKPFIWDFLEFGTRSAENFSKFEGGDIMIIDDIVTSGATFKEINRIIESTNQNKFDIINFGFIEMDKEFN